MGWTKLQITEPTVIRLDERGSQAGWFSLMNCRADGWSSGCHLYPTLSALLDVWDIVLGRHDRDEWSAFIVANPRPKGER
jgi:hypothetical protein